MSGEILDRNYDDAVNKIRAELHGIKEVALTLDFWESKQRLSYLGVTAHNFAADLH